MKEIAIIRHRGQITIPDKVRKQVGWAKPDTAVSVSADDPTKIVISLHSSQDVVDWEQLWADIKRVRLFKGKGRGNLSTFIAEDRASRR